MHVPLAIFGSALQLYPCCGVLRKIILALSLTTTGVNGDNLALINAGATRYTEALQTAAVALATPQKLHGDGLLVAVRFLSLYEVSVIQS